MHTTHYIIRLYNTEHTALKYNTLIQHGTYNTKYLTQKYNTHATHYKTCIQHEHTYTTQQYNTFQC